MKRMIRRLFNQLAALALVAVALIGGYLYITGQSVQVTEGEPSGWVDGARWVSVFQEPGAQLVDVIDASKPVKVLLQHESGWWKIEYTTADGKVVTGYVGLVDGLGGQK